MSTDAIPASGFACILADPPWPYATYSAKGQGRSASQHYAVMSVADICALPVAGASAHDSFLFLWTTTPHLPVALGVLNAWGFAYSTVAFVWVKTNKGGGYFMGMGHTTRQNAEFVLLGRRGKPARVSRSVSQIVAAPRREHSRKPDDVRARIEAFCAGPRLELFARDRRPGWTAWGNETDKFASESR